jgi:hypothetical protein
MPRSTIRRPHAFRQQIIVSSHIAAGSAPVLGPLGARCREIRASWITPSGPIFNLGIRGRSGHPRSVPDPLSWTTRAPSEGNATAKQGCERRPPIAYNLPLGACTLTHAFQSCPTWTQPTSLKHGCCIVAQHRVSCRWSTPQRKTEKIPSSGAFNQCLGSLRGSLSALYNGTRRSQFFAERRATRLSATCPRHRVPSAWDARLEHPHRREPRRRTLSPTSSATTPPRRGHLHSLPDPRQRHRAYVPPRPRAAQEWTSRRAAPIPSHGGEKR